MPSTLLTSVRMQFIINILLLSLYFWSLQIANAVTLSSAEYFIVSNPWLSNVPGALPCENDPGEGNGIPLPASDGTWNSSTEMAKLAGVTPALPSGIHDLCVRFKDSNGQWGLPRLVHFSTGRSLAACEYYIDTDPGAGKGKILPATDGSFDTNQESLSATQVPITGLTSGGHTVGIRCRDEWGRWGSVKTTNFAVTSADSPPINPPTATTGTATTIATGAILHATVNDNGAATTVYFEIGRTTDYGSTLAATSGTIGPNAGNTAINLTLSGFGCNTTYHYRVKVVNTVWTSYGSDANFTTLACTAPVTHTLVTAEYFIDPSPWLSNTSGSLPCDNDPGEGHGTPLPSNDGVWNSSTEIARLAGVNTTLPPGTHDLCVRFKDDIGQWSRPRLVHFSTGRGLAACEYYLDTDPGVGMGKALSATDGSLDTNQESLSTAQISTTGLALGTHIVGTRCRDEWGRWGAVKTGSFTISNAPVTYTVTPSAGIGGSINPATTQTVAANATTAFTVTPNAGYTRDSIVNGTCQQGSWNGNIWTTGAVTTNCTVSFSFTANPITYTVTPSAGDNGTISPNIAQTVTYGTTTAFTLTPNTGYSIANVTGCSGSLSGNIYTTGPISADCTVTATFSLNTYTVTPSAGTGGTIDPNTAQQVAYNTTKVFTLTPNTGYSIANVTGCGGSLSGNIYTTEAITANCTVTATFTPTCNATWIPQTSGITNVLGGIVWSGSQFVAVADNGVVITSPEGVNWSKHSANTSNTLNGIAWSGIQFVAVAGLYDRSLIYTSPDAITWTEHVSAGNPVLRSVVWNGGLNQIIAVGEQGAILNSGPGATTWTVAQSGQTYTLNAITSNGNISSSMQVAVGTGSTIITSSDGITWTPRSAPVQNVNLRTVIWNGGKFIAAGDKPMVFSSTDGITWTANAAPSALDFYNIEWNGSKYIAVGSTVTATSPDGINWTILSTQTNPLRDIAWSGTELVAVGDNGTVLRYCVPNQQDVIAAVSYDQITPASMPKTGYYAANSRVGGLDYLVNARVFSALTGGVIESGGQLSLSLNGTLVAYLFSSQLDLTFHGLNTGDIITAIYSGTDKYRRSTASITVGSTFALTVATTGTGTVTTNQTSTPDIRCGTGGTDCGQQYAQTTPAAIVTLIANPVNGSTFIGWNGDCSGTATTCTVNMTAAKNVTANFSTVQNYTLGITKAGNGSGTITSNPTGINCGASCSSTYAANTAVTLTPTSTTGSSFTGWSGDADCADGQVTMSANVTCIATFALNTYVVTPIAGTGGTISPNNAQTLNYGANISFTLAPNTGYNIASVTGCSGNLSGNTYTTGAITANCTVTASFVLTTVSYTVTPIIGKGGTVTPSTPQTVTANTAKSFTVVPKTGYIKSPKGIIGTCSLGSWNGNIWTTGNITANCSVNFDFFCSACIPSQGGWRAVIGH